MHSYLRLDGEHHLSFAKISTQRNFQKFIFHSYPMVGKFRAFGQKHPLRMRQTYNISLYCHLKKKKNISRFGCWCSLGSATYHANWLNLKLARQKVSAKRNVSLISLLKYIWFIGFVLHLEPKAANFCATQQDKNTIKKS